MPEPGSKRQEKPEGITAVVTTIDPAVTTTSWVNNSPIVHVIPATIRTLTRKVTAPAETTKATGPEPTTVSTKGSLPTTTTTEVSIPTPTSAEVSTGGSISSAEAGGIGAGAAVGSMLLVLVALLCYNRFGKRRLLQQSSTLSIAAGALRQHEYNVLDQLPPQVTDTALCNRLGDLKTRIKNCVDTFFKHSPTSFDSTIEVTLCALAGPPVDGQSWSAALVDEHVQPLVIRSLLAQILFKHIDPRTSPETTLLPSELLAVYQSLQPPGDPAEFQELLATWRQITGHYISDSTRSEQSARQANMIANSLLSLRPEPVDGFRQILEGLVSDASQLGLDLFRSPDGWMPTWERSSEDGDKGIVVFPGVLLVRQRNVFDSKHGRPTRKIHLSRALVEY